MSETTQVAKPIDYAALMAQAAQQAMEQEKPDNKFVSFKSGVLSFNGAAAPGNKVDIVVLGAAFENQYFPHRYDPNKILSPDCYAVSHHEDDLAPIAEDCTAPFHTDCATCPNNAWESDPNGGKGKACKNTRRLAMVLASNIGDPSADIMYARLPVTSVANWSKYVTQIGNVVKRPPFGVITELSVVPDVKSQFKVCFQFKGLIDDQGLEMIVPLQEQASKDILFGYPKNAAEPAPVAAPKGKGKI